MQFIVMPIELVQRLGNYLGTKPYSEVAGFVNEISVCKMAVIPEQPAEEHSEKE